MEEMQKPTLAQLSRDYITLFGLENVEQLKTLYADTISLIDWTGQWDGKENVLAANRSFFDANTFTITLLETDTCGKKTYNRIRLAIEGGETLDIMDVITFDTEDKIFEIKAYKC